MNRSTRMILFLSLAAVLLITSANAAIDYLSRYSNKVSKQAMSAAENAVPIVSLTGENLSLYRLGYAAGFDAANKEKSVLTRLSNESATNTYILNNWSKKFHKPSCEYAQQISEKNKLVFTCTRQEVIDQGYIPCKVCKP